MAVQFPGQASRYTSAGLAASGVVSAQRGYVMHLRAINTNGATRYIQLFNSATVPADTAVPVRVLALATGASGEINLQELGDFFSTGISWCTSSTLATKTVGAADAWVEMLYVDRRA